MRTTKIILIALLAIFAGCAKPGLQEVPAGSENTILHYERGVITNVRPVAIKDNGTGTFIGSIVGAVLGSTVGRGRGSVLASLAGGLGGAYVGSEVAKANAQELSVQLDDTGENVIVIAKGLRFKVGDHIKIVKKNRKIVEVVKE
ncbi:MAG: glycine zipper 2TM domain-containing protein [Epsilonproteobacteria bacterium]|nr:glycine zipper 2TM domain-containing protein [Campylobacterota bacterium]